MFLFVQIGCPAGITGYRCEVLPAGYVAPATVTAAVTAPAPVPVVITPVVVAGIVLLLCSI
jgi:hypothetical protein